MATTPQSRPRAFPDLPATAPERPYRWTLSRAGIINVYQYGNETLHFGGGRLLLRGVNGSGKSTAMNMLLPFLLDAHTRRIDAAGEQSGMLRSWMLSGRDEAQPVGYLWLEVAKEDDYLSFGCGIRANRSSDQVTTWWFVTSRRPGIDFQLVEARVPLGRDALKTLLDPGPVFGHEQRAQYRAELQKRLFGGADIEQHLHLLRIVRNPRVGDRLDAELPQYLHDALPQLSDAALDDAAQPLEDLEEHRRNVADLDRTAGALVAIHATYRNYARSELHRLADRTAAAVRVARESRRKEEDARRAHDAAIERRRDAETRKRQIDTDVEGLQTTIEALKASEAYKSGAELNDLRAHVQSLGHQRVNTEETLRRRQAATERVAGVVRAARREAAAEHEALGRRVADVASAASACALAARPPGVPSIAPDPASPRELALAPPEPIETAAADQVWVALQAAGRERMQDVESVAAAVRAIDPAERAVREAETKVSDAQAAREDAVKALTAARTAFQQSVEDWQRAAADWLEQLRRHHATHGLDAIETPAEIGTAADAVVIGRPASASLDSLTAPARRHHEDRRARLEASLTQQREIVAELERLAADLAAKELPDPPLLGWQRRTGRCFAELVDFAEHVDATARAGLEAALEASGVLAAEVHDGGALRLADGQLAIAADAPEAQAPLGALLRPDVRDDDPHSATGAALERILRVISTDTGVEAATVATVDGEFRLGAARGKHAKAAAEHIGVTARRATLERLRAENAFALARAKAELERITAAVEAAVAALNEALALRAAVPSDQALHQALWQRTQAEDAVEKADARLRLRRAELESAEWRHAEAVTHAKTTAAQLSLPPSLPPSLDELDAIRGDLERLISDAREARAELGRVARAVERWRDSGQHWREACADEAQSEAHLASLSAEWSSAQTRLVTLDATIGVAYAEVVARVARKTEGLESARQTLTTVESELQQAVGDVRGTESDCRSTTEARERADADCVQALGVLKRALTVPGLVDAATRQREHVTHEGSAAPSEPGDAAREQSTGIDVAAAFAAVEDSPAGARRLVDAIRAHVPPAGESLTSAEGVRQSIRNRRDSFGAGWDAGDRQPDPELPLHVEVTGPLAQQTPLPAAAEIVHGQLATMQSLLSAKQHQALRNLLQGLVAREVADKLHAAGELIERMNERLSAIKTSHGIGVELRWRRRDDLDPEISGTIRLLEKPPDLRTAEEDARLSAALGRRIDDAHREDPGTPYRELIARVLDYREWHHMAIILHRPGHAPERLGRRTRLSEGEKKIVSYLPLFAAVAASCDGLAASAPDALRFLLLDDAFAKVSEDNHAKLFGLLVELDLDFIATSERLWGTHDTVPKLAITEVIRDADFQTIVLEHSRWNGRDLRA